MIPQINCKVLKLCWPLKSHDMKIGKVRDQENIHNQCVIDKKTVGAIKETLVLKRNIVDFKLEAPI